MHIHFIIQSEISSIQSTEQPFPNQLASRDQEDRVLDKTIIEHCPLTHEIKIPPFPPALIEQCLQQTLVEGFVIRFLHSRVLSVETSAGE